MHVRGDDVAHLVEATGASPSVPVLAVPDVTRAVALVEEALRGMERDDSAATLQLAAGAAWHLLALLSATRHGVPHQRRDPVQAAVEYLQLHFAEKITVSELAATAGLSPSHFSALFRRATGCGPHEYQTRLRMMKSRQLLDTTDISVSAIARAVGYQDPLYFSRQFRAVHGMSASQHRARAKG
jgi:AraC family transcriptional regulator, arabinose operon regulatory protein